MVWSKKKTVVLFAFVFLMSLLCALVSIVLFILQSLNFKSGSNSMTTNGLYYMAVLYGSGLGCVWFRVFHSKVAWSHGMLHVIVFALMCGGVRKMGDSKNKKHDYALALVDIPLYIIQIILAIHLVIVRYGRTPAERAFRSGLHAFLGALLFFICSMDGLLNLYKAARDNDRDEKIESILAVVFALLYAIFTWYLILNPYFDWRRLAVFFGGGKKSKFNARRPAYRRPQPSTSKRGGRK